VLVFIALVIYPFESTVVPQWKMRVIDESGNAVRGVGVKEGWRHYSVETRRHEESLITDNEGYVTFPRRKVRAGLLVRAVGRMITALNPHGRSGPHAFADVMGSYSGTADYSPGKPLPTTLIVLRVGSNRVKRQSAVGKKYQSI
jgi:hypothetical protein